MLRPLQEVEKDLAPGFLLCLHDNGWSFQVAAQQVGAHTLSASLLPYDEAARILLRVRAAPKQRGEKSPLKQVRVACKLPPPPPQTFTAFAAETVMQDIDNGHLSMHLRDMFYSTDAPVVDGCIMIEVC